MSNWGKAHINNTNGFGRASQSNNDFGSVYNKSDSGKTNLESIFADSTLAFSLRDLGLGASHVVRVRRDSDNTEQDFTATEITDGSLLSFVGSGNGFVTVWYNQKGLYNAEQTSAVDQPRIVNNGSLILKNNKPSIRFGISQGVRLSNILFPALGSNKRSVFSVHTQEQTMQRPAVIYLGQENQTEAWGATLEHAVRIFGGNYVATPSASSNQLETATFVHPDNETNVDKTKIYRNNNLLQTSSTTGSTINTQTGFELGYYFSGVANIQSFLGTISEIIIFEDDDTQIINNVNQNINNYYAIY